MVCPLVVDLDGILVRTDMLHESALKLFKANPFKGLELFFLWFKSKALFKQKLTCHADIDPTTLPYHDELIIWLRQQKETGRRLVLCTKLDLNLVVPIAQHLGFIDEVIGSDEFFAIEQEGKLAPLEQKFGRNGFDYVGNSKTDLLVWERARRGIFIDAADEWTKKAESVCEVEQVFYPKTASVKTWIKALRVHQWLKNSLLFIPLVAAHQLTNEHCWFLATLACAAFCLCASSVYVANDLFDLESDRLHPHKKRRAFASGQLPPWVGFFLAPLLLVMGLSFGYYVGQSFLFWMLIYLSLTSAYSWGLKRFMWLDCLLLTTLYTLRIIAGAFAVQVELSSWLIVFSGFFFLSLSFVKRYAELELLSLNNKQQIHGRAYHTSDKALIRTLGVSAGYAAILVLILYLTSEKVVMLYKSPKFMWATVPILWFWISFMWLQAQRGCMHDDPLLFAIKNKISLFMALLFTAALTLGAIGFPW